jgi:7,8-dihydropterin-6-yl-methyl-4-(beta-D-ribofuranosyl)aminobenzene 5'-phosphate synthase
METNGLKSVNRIEVTTLLDNYVDILLEGAPHVRRPPLAKGEELPTDTLVAEHGLSLLIKTIRENQDHSVLLDTGYNSHSLIHNMEWLGIDMQTIESIVISHSHMDHAGGIYSLVEKMTPPVSVVAHPGIFSHPRLLKFPDGRRLQFPTCYDPDKMQSAGIDVTESKGPTPIAGDTIVVTGEVERTTGFEKGMPGAFVEKNNQLQPDIIEDDQSLILNLEGRGLVLITGCCHAGLINTLHYAEKITGIKKVHAVLGGFHLSGAAFAPIVENTIEALSQINPEIIIPMHCTGWQSTHRLAEAFPKAFILNSVGTTYILE